MKTRLDKYLWAVRLAKTRSQATELISKGKVLINELPVKASKEVKRGEIIMLLKHSARFQYKVIELLDKRVGAALVKDYILDLTTTEELEKLRVYQESQRNYRLTDGKPTKKDRRELDRFMEDWQAD